jgi:hypothetical protein
MKVLGLNRVELLVNDPDDATNVFNELFNGAHFRPENDSDHGEPVDCRIDWKLGIELVHPTDPNHFMGQLQSAKGEHVFTVVFEVESIDDARTHLKKKGFDIIYDHDFGAHDDIAQHKQICVSPARTHGLLIMLLEKKMKS